MKKLLTLMLLTSMSFVLTSCGEEATNNNENDQENEQEEIIATDYTGITIGKADYAAHGTYSFAATTVALAGDIIADVVIDEYQYLAVDTYTGVPNSDQTFGATTLAAGKVLASKALNDEAYSANMANAGSTQNLSVSIAAIEEFVVGKTISELEAWASTAEGADSVVGSTLVDTVGYVNSVIAAAKNAPTSSSKITDVEEIKLGKVEAAAHGTYCFTLATAAVAEGKIIAAYVDEYQYLAVDSYTGVPNSDQSFGATMLAEGKVLASKRSNDEAYSANMANSGSTQSLATSWEAIEEFVTGKTISELEAWASTAEGADSVVGSTLVDTVGYVNAIIEAAKAAE